MQLLSTICLLSIIPLLIGQQIGFGVDVSRAIMRREIRKHIIEVVGNKTSAPATMPYDIEFGGEGHKDDEENNAEKDLMRPELVKSEQCKGNVCTDCSHRSQCWHGFENDKLQVNVQAGVTTEFAVEIWSRCAKNGDFSIWSELISNGIVAIYKDSGLVKEVAKATGDRESDTVLIPIIGGRTFRLRIAFRPGRDASSKAEAQIEAKLKNADPYTDKCMGVKDCLKVFGDKSDAGFEMRNSNKVQLRCLQGKMLLTWALRAKCRQWLICLPSTEKAKLKTFLSASLVKRGGKRGGKRGWKRGGSRRPHSRSLGLGMVEGSKLVTHVDSTCFDPASEDPEAWDCECLQGMIDKCGGLDEECIKGLMCDNGKVCLTWKQQQCSSAQINAHQTALLARRVHAITKISDNLGDALRGKCSQ